MELDLNKYLLKMAKAGLQSRTRQNLVFMWNGALQGGSIAICREFCASVGGICILGGGLGTGI